MSFPYYFGKRKSPAEAKKEYEDLWTNICPYFGPISYKDLEEHVLPLITADELIAGRQADSDQKLPSFVQSAFAQVEIRSRLRLDLAFTVVVWLLARKVTNYRRFRTSSGDSSLFRKDVICTGFLIGIPTYSFALDYLSTFRTVFPDRALLAIKKDPQLSLYRKRLIEFKPEYANKKYRLDKGLTSYDGINFSELEKKEDKELIEDKDVFIEEGDFEGEIEEKYKE
ncbi:unnamed protein product [Blepharisma stoltei]|uniref:Uncharacterized protein n=1 Tax=Blepharisma stoltei TaxID=1481888 RepID=A0AAU9K2U3_9CILI|nr:unnamed protein product [Blepharisma stoltei]